MDWFEYLDYEDARKIQLPNFLTAGNEKMKSKREMKRQGSQKQRMELANKFRQLCVSILGFAREPI